MMSRYKETKIQFQILQLKVTSNGGILSQTSSVAGAGLKSGRG